MVQLCTLGTGGTLPLADRALSSLYIRVNGCAVVVDCGEGTQVGIRKLGWGFRCIDGILLTHFHGDHCTGVVGLLLSIDKSGREEPFHIWGPQGLKRIIEGLCVVAPALRFPVFLHEIPLTGKDFDMIGLNIRAFPVNHGGIPFLGYRFVLPRTPEFDAGKALALGIPKSEWKTLQYGESVLLGDREITPQEVQGKLRKGITFVYCTDTRPCETLAKYVKGTDLAILEGMYGNPDKYDRALKNHHMMFSEAAGIAKESSANKLLLTHFSTSVDDPSVYLEETRKIFPETYLGEDGMEITIKYPKEQEKAWVSLS